jgi:c-di-GMP-related signal transduction protein
MTDEIKTALANRTGLMGEALNCVQSYERGDWSHTRFATLDRKAIRDAYLNSLTLTRGMTQEFSA